ncbi:MAG: hypothetical protein ACREVE_13700 [Gammaproteobacteria bacterium]
MNEIHSLSPTQGAFVIQFRSPRQVRQGCFTGRAEHVASGKVEHFRTPDELIAFVTGALTAHTPESATERADLAGHALAVRRRQARPFLFPGGSWRQWKQSSQVQKTSGP